MYAFQKPSLTILASSLLLAKSAPLLYAAEPPPPDKPNIVFIFSDDHALRTIGAYNDSLHSTPNIDRLADQGMTFDQSFCTNSICCPSRASILTGKHSHKNGVIGNGARWNSNQFVFSRELKKAGYKTGLIGKWHLKGMPDDAFDYWNILSGAGGQGHYYNPDFINHKGESSRIEGYSTDVITDQALEWMKKSKSEGKPFMMMCQFKAPHIHRVPPPRHMNKYDGQTIPEPVNMFDNYKNRSPYAGKSWMEFKGMQEPILNIVPLAGQYNTSEHKFQFLGRMTNEQRSLYHRAYDPKNNEYRKNKRAGLYNDPITLEKYKYQRFIKDYLGCVSAIDDNVGRIMNWLEETGLAENTIVIYSSDQGFYTGEHGWNDKRWMYEESLKMPFIIRWPGVTQPNTRSQAMIQNIDYAPTFIEAAGGYIPDEIQGRSLTNILKGDVPADWRDAIYYHYYDDGAYNLPRFEGVRTAKHKLIHYYYPDEAWEMFDLEQDPNEMKSVYNDDKYSDVQALLHKKLAELRNEYDLPALNRESNQKKKPQRKRKNKKNAK
ncbi:sulfatase family protein [Poriferisphaera sp. WC338]|uniref:sulfatase family protein n=1 Tax=Poriferisphaera sp. WC338 TaxID=3425129 RepID=UPI003D81B0C9